MKEKKDFELILDEMYLNSTHSSSTIVKSGIFYADKYPNIHVVRGFAKDYGLCGFKLGILISTHPQVRLNYNKWEKLIYPQPFLLKTLSLLLEKSGYGE